MSVLKNIDWFEELETPDNVIVATQEVLEADQYIIDNDFFDGDFFSIEMYWDIIEKVLEKYWQKRRCVSKLRLNDNHSHLRILSITRTIPYISDL